MKMLKKILIFSTISAIIVSILTGSTPKNSIINLNNAQRAPIKVAVFLSRANDRYISDVGKKLEDIQKENEGKVEFSFFDGKGNQVIQNESIERALNDSFDMLLINLVDTKIDSIGNMLSEILAKNIPFILDGTPSKDVLDYIKSSNRTFFIGSDLKQSGELQGKIIVDSWNSNKKAIDINNDNVLQYIMLQGQTNSPGAIDRTKYSISTINDAGIKTQQLALQGCGWEKECAKTSIESLFLRYGDKIEAIIANNDSMAIGAIEAIQKYGYNTGNPEKNILVVGVDAISEAKDLVNKGLMTGTVIQDARAEAEAMYTVGMNLVNNKSPLYGTKYKLNENNVLLLPYEEYTKQ